MAINENSPETAPSQRFDAHDAENKKGQMLVIYLPEGSVIVDRTDIDLANTPHQVIEKTITAPSAQQSPTEPVAASPQPVQHTLQELVQITVQEVLQTNTTSKKPDENPSGPNFIPNRPRRIHGPRVRHRRRLNWVHGINTMLVTYIVLVSVLPSVMSSFFGVSIYASKAAHPRVSIASGDLMICREVPAVALKVNDVVLVRGVNTWRLDARQVTANSIDATSATITTAATSGAAAQSTMAMPVASSVYKVSTIVPKLGYVPMFLSATISKVIGALIILVLNLRVHYRRGRRNRANSNIQ